MEVIARATVQVPGTCGELVQGAIDGVSFLVSCPIDLFSTVTVELTGDGVVLAPPDCAKAEAALRAGLRFVGRPELGARLSIASSLPRGKGMGSSTADIAGALGALARALDREVTPAEVARLALAIEPSDSSIFPGLALFDHRAGRVCESLGTPPPLDIIMIDPGGEIDTVDFNRHDRSAILRELEPQIQASLARLKEGLESGRPDLLGQAATMSALANQRILYKPDLDSVLDLAQEIGALGVNVGHSGTVIGVLIDPRTHDPARVRASLQRRLPRLEAIYSCRLVGGGWRPVADLASLPAPA